MNSNPPRLMIAAPGSGGGKTLLTCGLLRLLGEEGLRPAAFKAGPDYIDPLFHRQTAGESGGNLDLFFTDEAAVRSLLMRGAVGCDLALIEGVMGFYDGVGGGEEGSSYHIARATGTPVLLLVDARGASLSLAALVRGFASFRPDANIRGVVLGRCSPTLYDHLFPLVQDGTGLPVLGYLPQEERFHLPSRHLGLVPPQESGRWEKTLEELASRLRGTLDLAALLRIARSARPLGAHPYHCGRITQSRPRLAVARDQAFCFYYRENLRMLQELGAELLPFSPLGDERLPPDIHGLYLGGGYPELYARQLSENRGLLAEIRGAVGGGLPTVAECGGFLYLQEALEDPAGRTWPMAGYLQGVGRRRQRLSHFGYIRLTARRDNLYCRAGEEIPAHEFHYWHSTHGGDAFQAQKPGRNAGWTGMVAEDNLVAGFPHLYYPANPGFAQNFVRAMAARQGGVS